MLRTITITHEDIFQQIKLNYQIPEIIEKIVARKVIKDVAAKVGINAGVEELQEAADKFRLWNQLRSAEETWAWMGKNSLSLEDFEELIYANFIIDKLAQHLLADKVEPYFFEHQLDYASAIIYEVILDDEDLAMELFYALTEGETNFYEIVHQYIQNSELRRSGGYRGIVSRQDLRPEISAAVFAAKPPQILKPIVTAKGIYLILVEEIIQPELDDNLLQKISSELFSKWMKQQIQEIEVVKQFDSTSQNSNHESKLPLSSILQ